MNPPTPTSPLPLLIVRAIGFVLIAIAAVVTTASAPPANQSDVEVARITADSNEEEASSAPQQQVVNGWEAADLLDVIATRSTDDRVPQLLLLLIAAVCWGGATSGWVRNPTRQ